jgi:hypothetical protein
MNDAVPPRAALDFPVPAGTPGSEAGSPAQAGALTDGERQVLDFELRTWPAATGAKDLAIHTELGMTPTRYYQVLNGLIDRPEALAHAPALVNRLRTRRSSRGALRAGKVPDPGARRGARA